MIAADLEWKLWIPAANGQSRFDSFARSFGSHGYRVREAMSPANADIYFRELVMRELALRPWERNAA